VASPLTNILLFFNINLNQNKIKQKLKKYLKNYALFLLWCFTLICRALIGGYKSLGLCQDLVEVILLHYHVECVFCADVVQNSPFVQPTH
jgi:fatty-acid desaturase